MILTFQNIMRFEVYRTSKENLSEFSLRTGFDKSYLKK